jgi:hypothetical protein
MPESRDCAGPLSIIGIDIQARDEIRRGRPQIEVRHPPGPFPRIQLSLEQPPNLALQPERG